MAGVGVGVGHWVGVGGKYTREGGGERAVRCEVLEAVPPIHRPLEMLLIDHLTLWLARMKRIELFLNFIFIPPPFFLSSSSCLSFPSAYSPRHFTLIGFLIPPVHSTIIIS